MYKYLALKVQAKLKITHFCIYYMIRSYNLIITKIRCFPFNAPLNIKIVCRVPHIYNPSLSSQISMENFKAADVEFQARFRHENIAELYGVLLYDQNIHLFMEAGEGGSVLEKLESCGPMREFEIIWVTKQILRGLEYLHSHNIIHHDIKRNIFIY